MQSVCKWGVRSRQGIEAVFEQQLQTVFQYLLKSLGEGNGSTSFVHMASDISILRYRFEFLQILAGFEGVGQEILWGESRPFRSDSGAGWNA